MDALRRLLIHRDESVSLDIAALQIAAVEYPGLDENVFLELLDSHAREIEPAVRTASPQRFVRILNEYLFVNLGFQGNQQDYYNVNNSCLNQVILSRTGIPITLSVVYMEIARRLQRQIVGIGLPGHFFVQYQQDGFHAWIDCFHNGRILDFEDCRQLAQNTARIDILAVPDSLRPVSHWQTVVRMLDNLRNVYYRNREWEKAIRVLDLLIEARPERAAEYRERGVLHLEQKRPASALADLERYVALAPKAGDRPSVEAQIKLIRGLLRSIN